MLLSAEIMDEAPVIPVDCIELTGLQLVEEPKSLYLYLDFSSERTGRPKVGFLLAKSDDNYLNIEMDTQLPFRCIPDATIQLSEMLACLWTDVTINGVEDLFARACAKMVSTVIKVKIKKISRDKVVFTCAISGYTGQATCDLADVGALVEVLK